MSRRRYLSIIKQTARRIVYLDFYSGQRAIALHKLKLIYIPLPKCGNTLLKSEIARVCYPEKNEFIHSKSFFEYIGPGLANRLVHKGGYAMFCVVRDPAKRFQSAYRDKVRNKGDHFGPTISMGLNSKSTFDELISEVYNWPSLFLNDHFRNQVDLLKGYDLNLIKFYDLDSPKAMASLVNFLGKKNLDLDLNKKLNQTAGDQQKLSDTSSIQLDKYLSNDVIFFNRVTRINGAF